MYVLVPLKFKSGFIKIMKKSKILAILGTVIGLIIIIIGFFMKNTWQVCAGTYMILWVYEVYQNHKLMQHLTSMLASKS